MFRGAFSDEVRSALFALASVGLGAWLYLRVPTFRVGSVPFGGTTLAVLACAAIAVLIGIFAGRLAQTALPGNPILAMILLEARALVALVILALITWATLCTTGLLAADDSDPATRKQYLDALEKAATAVISALGAAIAGGKSGNAVAVLAQETFEAAFKTYGAIPPSADDLEVQHAAFSDPYIPERTMNKDGSAAKGADGWGFEARWARARAISANL